MNKETIQAKISEIEAAIKNLNENISNAQNAVIQLTANLNANIGAKQVLTQLLEDNKEEVKEDGAAK